jgi:3-phenylpropionate/cinnamic acid dioxygenase small subunit
LSYGDARHQAAAQFLVEEAHLLDTADYEAWLSLLDPSIRYRMPVRVTAVKAASEADVQTMDHFDEDLYSLRKRVERFQTSHAWTEDPQSRVRHHVSNVRTFASDDGRLRVESAVLLLAERMVEIDESVLRTQNLAIFL